MRKLELYIDIFFCVIVLPIMGMLFPIERWWHFFTWYVIAVCIWLYMLYFINRMVTVPLLFKGDKSRWIGIILICVSILITCFFSRVSLYNPKPSIREYDVVRKIPSVEPYQQAVWSLFMIVEAFSCMVGLLTQSNKQRSRLREIEEQRDKAEISLYKAQIKPHFMFNTLNSLYGLFLTNNEKALTSLEKYISMMRYVHYSSNKDMTKLAEEVDYIRQYVGLQSLRLNGKTKVDLKIEISNEDLMVPPMLLVTFVENCFKHGVSPDEESDIGIHIYETDGRLEFHTLNRIFPIKSSSGNMGLANSMKRLELLYPDRHKLQIKSDNNNYSVKLVIDLNV